MKSSQLALVLTALFASCTSQAAHIVSVETKLIITDSKYGKNIQTKIAKEQEKLAIPFKDLEAKIKKQEEAIKKAQIDLAKEDEAFKAQAQLLSPDARAEKYDELQRKHREIEEEIASFQRTMRQAQEDAKKVDQKLEGIYRKEMMVLEQTIKNTIEELAKTHGWDIVLAKEAVIYAGPATDKTDIVIAQLDAQADKEEKAAASKAASDKAKNALTKQAA